VQTSNYDGAEDKFGNEDGEAKPLWASYPLEIQQCSATGFTPKLSMTVIAANGVGAQANDPGCDCEDKCEVV